MYRILLADDEPLILEGLKSIIDWSAYGTTVTGAALNGRDALAILQKQRIDILITDIRMPQLDGLALLEAIRRLRLGTKVIILSGYDDFKYVKAAAVLGIENYLLKPIDKKELTKTIISTVSKLDASPDSRELVEEGIDIIRNNLLLRVLFATIDRELLGEKLRVLDMPPLTAGYAVGMIKPRQESAGFQRRLTKLSWIELGRWSGVNNNCYPVVPPRANALMVLFYGNEKGPSRRELGQSLSTILSLVEEKTGDACLAFLGRFVESLQEIPHSLQSAEELYRDRSCLIQRRIHDWEESELCCPEVEHPLIKRIIKHIHEHLEEVPSLKTLSYTLQMNQAYLGQLFKKEMKESFGGYVNRIRMKKAKTLLKNTHYRAGEIGYLIGFADPQYFFRTFKRHTGLTPSEYRRVKDQS